MKSLEQALQELHDYFSFNAYVYLESPMRVSQFNQLLVRFYCKKY